MRVLDLKYYLSRNLIDFINPAVIQGIFLCLNLLYFTVYLLYFLFNAFINSNSNRL